MIEKKDFILISFVATTMIMSPQIILDCSTLVSKLPYGPILLDETLVFISNSIELHSLLSLKIHARLCKDPSFL